MTRPEESKANQETERSASSQDLPRRHKIPPSAPGSKIKKEDQCKAKLNLKAKKLIKTKLEAKLELNNKKPNHLIFRSLFDPAKTWKVATFANLNYRKSRPVRR